MQLKSLLKEMKRWAKSGSPQERKAFWRTFAFEHLMDLPVVFTDQNGMRFVLYPGQNAEVYFKNQGNYEVAETRYCESYLKPGMIALDVGANIGMYAIPMARLVGEKGRVHSFEPEDKNYDRLLVNLAINGLKNVTVVKSAVFSETKVLKLNLFPDNISSWHSLGMPEMPDPWNPGKMVKPSRVVEVPGVSLDDYCADNGIERVDFLKVDVEGAELEVLQGCKRMFAENRIRQIMFEVSLPQIQSMGHGAGEIFQYLADAGFQCRPILAEGTLGGPVDSAGKSYGNYIAAKGA
jgi:FkbM family methyltransferase